MPRSRESFTGAQNAYRSVLWQAYNLIAAGNGPEPAVCRDALGKVTHWGALLGEPAATKWRRRWAREWYLETGRCPTCGEQGPHHDSTGADILDIPDGDGVK